MSKTLTEIAQQLKDANKKVQLIYAFNGTGKTRLSREFKDLIAPKNVIDEAEDSEDSELARTKILYYNAFTEDLFYWDNDLESDAEPKLIIQPNSFTDWILRDQGQDRNIISNFQRYCDEKLTPQFSTDFAQATFSFARGNEEAEQNIKLSKGEESNFIWSIFYSLLDLALETLNVVEESERDTDQFDKLEYVFIDDPVSSMDENHLIELAVNLASLIKASYFSEDGNQGIRFIITTHNPLFYNVLHNELANAGRHMLKKYENGTYDLDVQQNDSPFSYHLYIKNELEKAIESGQISKYHFNFLRNILEKTSTFLGYKKWGDLLPRTSDGSINPYEARIINLSSHSKHAGEEIAVLEEDDKRVLGYLVSQINEMYRFNSSAE